MESEVTDDISPKDADAGADADDAVTKGVLLLTLCGPTTTAAVLLVGLLLIR